jgi:hypothetical protein
MNIYFFFVLGSTAAADAGDTLRQGFVRMRILPLPPLPDSDEENVTVETSAVYSNIFKNPPLPTRNKPVVAPLRPPKSGTLPRRREAVEALKSVSTATISSPEEVEMTYCEIPLAQEPDVPVVTWRERLEQRRRARLHHEVAVTVEARRGPSDDV